MKVQENDLSDLKFLHVGANRSRRYILEQQQLQNIEHRAFLTESHLITW